jgi:hypothetical protein
LPLVVSKCFFRLVANMSRFSQHILRHAEAALIPYVESLTGQVIVLLREHGDASFTDVPEDVKDDCRNDSVVLLDA